LWCFPVIREIGAAHPSGEQDEKGPGLINKIMRACVCILRLVQTVPFLAARSGPTPMRNPTCTKRNAVSCKVQSKKKEEIGLFHVLCLTVSQGRAASSPARHGISPLFFHQRQVMLSRCSGVSFWPSLTNPPAFQRLGMCARRPPAQEAHAARGPGRQKARTTTELLRSPLPSSLQSPVSKDAKKRVQIQRCRTLRPTTDATAPRRLWSLATLARKFDRQR
jgi:hypothetical protein